MALTRKQMEAVIRGGGTVLYKGRGITSINNLPSAAAMAETEEEKNAAASDLQAQMEKLQQQMDALKQKPDETDEGKRESAVNALTRKNLDDLNKIVKDMRAEGYSVEFAEDAKKEAIVEAITNAKKPESK